MTSSLSAPSSASTSKDITRVTVATCIVFASFALADSGWGPLLAPLASQLHIALPTVGLFYSLWSAGYLPGTLLGGILIDRYGPRFALFWAACIIFCGWLSLGLTLFFPRFIPLALLLTLVGLSGIGGGIIDASSNGLISMLFASKRGTALSLFTILYPLCGVLIALVDATLLTVFHDNPLPSILLTIGVIVVASSTLLLIPPTYTMHVEHEAHQENSSSKKMPFLLLILPALLIMMFNSGLNSTLRTWTPAYLHVAFAQTPAAAAALSSIAWILSIVSRLVAAVVVLRVGTRRITVLCIIVAILGFILVLLSPNALLGTLALSLATIGLSPLFAIAITLGNELARRSPGAVAGVLLFAAGCCGVLSSWTFGYLLNSFNPHWAILFSLAIVILSIPGLLLLLIPSYRTGQAMS